MTIKISIENGDAARTVEVIEVSIDKVTGKRTEGPPYRLAPTCSTTCYVHLLKDVLVREIEP